MQKPPQDHIKWIYPTCKIIRAILLLVLSFLAYTVSHKAPFALSVSSSHVQWGWLLLMMTDFNSHGFSISKYRADSSTWWAGNFVITKHFMLLIKVTMFIRGGGGRKKILCARVTGNDLKHCLWGRHCCWFARGHFALSHPTYVSCDGSSRGESRQQVRCDRGDRAESCSMGSSGWQPRRGGLW